MSLRYGRVKYLFSRKGILYVIRLPAERQIPLTHCLKKVFLFQLSRTSSKCLSNLGKGFDLRGKKWLESQIEINIERLSLECLSCGRSGAEGYVIKFESVAITEYRAIHERMREHVNREHPEMIPTCKKCGYANECIANQILNK